MPPAHDMNADAELVRQSARKANVADARQAHLLAYAREATLASLLFCLLGLLGLAVCVIGNFDLRVGAEAEISRLQNGVIALHRSGYDLTSLFLGIASAGFAGTLVVCGGAAGHMRSMPTSSAYIVLLSGALSALGLVILVLQG